MGLFDDYLTQEVATPPGVPRITVGPGSVEDAPQQQPRGIRNNNPGNIEDGQFARSIPGYAGTDGRFAKYDTPEAGQAALEGLLQSYGRRGFNTPAGIVGRYAPASDGNPVGNYARYIAEGVGSSLTDQLDLNNPDVRRTVAQRIIEFENGKRQPAAARAAAPAPAVPTDFSAQSRQPAPAGIFGDYLAPQGQVAAPPASGPPPALAGGEPAPRVAREGMSEPAPPPPGFVDKLAAMWENPPKDRLSLIGMIKSAWEGATLPGDVASGKVAITGADGRTNPEVIQRSAQLAQATPMAAAPGGAFAGGAQAAAKTLGSVAEQSIPAAVPKGPAPTIAQLKGAAVEGFQSQPIKELAIAPRAISEFATGTRAALNESGIDEVLAPTTFRILQKLENAPEGAIITGDNLQTLRRTFGNAAGSIDKTERRAAKTVMDAIDNFIPEIAARDIVSGDPAAAAKAWQLARGNYAAASRAEDIAKAVLKAQRQAESAGSGANIDNATRQQFKAILNNDKRLRGFNAEEKAQMEDIVRGTATGNFARLIGKAAPTGIVSGALSGGAGLAAGGPVGAVLLPLAGLIGKKVGDRSTARQVEALSELVRSRAPLAKSMEDLAAKSQALQDQGRNARTMSALALSARNATSNLKDAGINISTADVMRALQGPVAGRAEDDQAN